MAGQRVLAAGAVEGAGGGVSTGDQARGRVKGSCRGAQSSVRYWESAGKGQRYNSIAPKYHGKGHGSPTAARAPETTWHLDNVWCVGTATPQGGKAVPATHVPHPSPAVPAASPRLLQPPDDRRPLVGGARHRHRRLREDVVRDGAQQVPRGALRSLLQRRRNSHRRRPVRPPPQRHGGRHAPAAAPAPVVVVVVGVGVGAVCKVAEETVNGVLSGGMQPAGPSQVRNSPADPHAHICR